MPIQSKYFAPPKKRSGWGEDRSTKRLLPTFKSLRAFEAAACIGSSCGAANEMNATQPAISRQVRRLEQQLAAKLLLRGSKASVPKPDCEAFFPRIKASFDDIAQAADTVSSEAGRTTPTLFVATFVSTQLIPPPPDSLRNDDPDVNPIFCNG